MMPSQAAWQNLRESRVHAEIKAAENIHSRVGVDTCAPRVVMAVEILMLVHGGVFVVTHYKGLFYVGSVPGRPLLGHRFIRVEVLGYWVSGLD